MIPPTSILVAVDFSPSSRLALMLGARLAKQCGASLTVLHVEDPLLAAAAKAEGIALSEETRAELELFVRSAAPAGEIARLHDVVSGDASTTISRVAQRDGVDLVVLGVRGMSGAEHAMFGSVTEGVLRRSGISVLAVPDTWAPFEADGTTPTTLGPVVAAVDFSPESEEAAAAACRLAPTLNTGVELWHVVPEARALARWRRHAEMAERDREAEATRNLASLAARLSSEAPLERHVATGRVAERLGEVAAPLGGRRALVVMGRRPTSDRDGAPGSTAYRMLTHASAPLLMHVAAGSGSPGRG